MSQSILEKVKQNIAEKFEPAIDFKAPYAKIILDMAAKATLQMLLDYYDHKDAECEACNASTPNLQMMIEDALKNS
jgi:hypothetical protein